MPDAPSAPSRAGHPPRMQRWWSQLCAITLLLGTLAVATAPTASAAETAITDGSVTWGVKASWRSYIGESGISIAGGVTRAAGGAFTWPVESGTFDDGTKVLELDLGGSVHFTAHEGALDMTISEPRLVIDGDDPQLLADVVSRSETTGEMVDYGEIPLATLDLDSGSPITASGTTTWAPLDARLAADAVRAFGGFYGSGIAIDPVSATYVGPGGKPEVTKESWDEPASLVYEEIGTAADIAGATAIMPDSDRHLVHVATATGLRAYDATTMEPLGEAVTPGHSSYPTPILDELSGAVVANSGGKLKAFTWNTETKAYDVTVVNETPMTQFSYDPNSGLTWGYDSTGLYYWVTNFDGTWYIEKFAYPDLPGGRVGFTVNSDWDAIFATAGSQPFVVALGQGAPKRIDLTDDYLNPDAAQAFYGYPTEAEAPVASGFVLSNYQGQVFTVKKVDGTYRLVGTPKNTGGSQVLRGTLDSDTGTTYLVDYAQQRLTAVKGDSVGQIPVEDLGIDSITPLAGSADGGIVYAGSYRGGEGSATYGLHRYRQLGVTPSVTTQPKDAAITLGTGDTTGTTSFSTAVSAGATIQWQTRPTSVGTFTDLTGETSTKLDVTATATDEGREFRAVVTNELGAMVTDTATLTVNTAPAVIIDPTDRSVTEGDDALFEVMPSGNPYPSITWQRRVGGYWTDIASSDTNFRIDGGKLTVRSTNLEQSGSLFRAELSNVVETVHSKAARLTVSEPSDAVRAIDSGDLDWGVKKSFRDYVVGPIAHGEITTSDGASRHDDGTFSFTAEDGTWDPTTETAKVTYDGTVTFTGHGGLLELTISDPELVVTGDEGILEAAVVSKTLETGELEDYGRVDLADLAGAELGVGGDTLTVAADTVTLSDEGAEAFAGFYEAGAVLDPIGSALALGDEVRAEPETPVTPPGTVTAPAAGSTKVKPKLSAKLSKSSVKARQRARLKVAVTVPGGRPTGQLVVRDGSKVIAVRTLKASQKGRITLTLPKLAKGRHYVKVTLNGTAAQQPTTSPFRALRVR